MSDGPISAPEAWTLEELAEAGWSEPDIAWEEAAAAAIRHLAEADRESARLALALGVRIATANLAATDPRLGCSLAGHGAALIESGDAHFSGRTMADAERAWRECDDWVAKMTAPRVARSSLFHLRMERRHRPTYEARWRIKWAELVEEARGHVLGTGTLTLLAPAEASRRLVRWERERPAMLNDTRKLIAAVLLLACRRA